MTVCFQYIPFSSISTSHVFTTTKFIENGESSVYIYTIPLVLAIMFLKHGQHILPNQCLSSLPAGIKPLASLGHIE